MKSLLQQVLGCQLPHPEIDFPAFIATVRRALEREPKIFDPLRNNFEPWVDVAELARMYNSSPVSSACAIS